MPAIIVDPDLLASVTRQFQLRGALAPFNLTENVVPIFDIGRLTGITQIQKVATPDSDVAVRVGTSGQQSFLPTALPAIDPADVFDGGVLTNPGAGDVVADTGQLVSGTHLVMAQVSTETNAFEAVLQWRNAANSGNVASYSVFATDAGIAIPPMILNLSSNERLRWVSTVAFTGDMASFIVAAKVSRAAA